MANIKPLALECVVFLAGIATPAKSGDEAPSSSAEGSPHPLTIYGTGFFVSVTEAGQEFRYLVTCRHVARPLNCGPWYILANRRGGNAEVFDAEIYDDGKTLSRWYFHPDLGANVDLAVMPAGLPDDVEWRPLAATLLLHRHELVATRDQEAEAAAQLIAIKAAGRHPRTEGYARFYTGNDIAMVSLFGPHHGEKRIHPIIRVGTLAMIPWEGELVPTRQDGKMELILIEARSIGGMSGSPAFIIESRLPDAQSRLLGVVRGHWEIPPEQKNRIGTFTINVSDAAGGSEDDDKVNHGIAGVVPAWRLQEILDHPELKAKRAEWLAEHRDSNGASSLGGRTDDS